MIQNKDLSNELKLYTVRHVSKLGGGVGDLNIP